MSQQYLTKEEYLSYYRRQKFFHYLKHRAYSLVLASCTVGMLLWACYLITY